LKNKANKAEEKADKALTTIDKLPCEVHKEILDLQKDNNRDRDIKMEKIIIDIDKLPCEAHREILDLQKDNNRDRDIKIEKIIVGMEKIIIGIDKLPCETHKEILDLQKDNNRDRDIKIEKMIIGMEYINKNISDMSGNINAIAEKMNTNIVPATPLTQAKSPIMLTDRGEEKVKELGIDRMVNDNWERITAIIEEKALSKNPYDIQQLCLDESMIFPEKFISPSDIDTIKLDAYKNGDILQSYMRMVAIIIRDRFFKEHNIIVADIDIHDPNKK
jgi:23S rRNA U2552 (ribose-2'-O)-methylase RlmE/FtsJ